MEYDQVVATLATMLEVPQNSEDSNFTRILPTMFAYADGRIYRELAFLVTTTSQATTLVARNREIFVPVNVLVLRSIDVFTPAGPVTLNSRRHPLERISPEALDMFWPNASLRPGVPQKYAIIGSIPPPPPVPGTQGPLSYTVRFMPTPDRAYPAEFLGVVRPEILSSTNRETFLSVHYPELFICACMVFGTGYQRDFGAQADDPTRAMSWETQYTYLRNAIMAEVMSMRGEAAPAAAQARAP
jgi:hypothetical protein